MAWQHTCVPAEGNTSTQAQDRMGGVQERAPKLDHASAQGNSQKVGKGSSVFRWADKKNGVTFGCPVCDSW